MRRIGRRRGFLLVAAALVAAGCGGDGGDAGDDGESVAEVGSVPTTESDDGGSGSATPDGAVGPAQGFSAGDPTVVAAGDLAVVLVGALSDDDTGAAATGLILAFQLQGISQEQIVDMLILGFENVDGTYRGEFEEGSDDCPHRITGGKHEQADFCDHETGEIYPDRDPPVSCELRQYYGEDCDDASEDDSGQTDTAAGTPCTAFAPPYSGVPIVASGSCWTPKPSVRWRRRTTTPRSAGFSTSRPTAA